jgi:hypothetical protein
MGALGVLQHWDQSFNQQVGQNAPYLTSRPMHPVRQANRPPRRSSTQHTVKPTHLLYANLAYPISEEPLFVGQDPALDGHGIVIVNQRAGASPKHCVVKRSGHDVVLENLSDHGTFVDGTQVMDNAVLQLGQVLRVGTPGETLQLIACREMNERPNGNHI